VLCLVIYFNSWTKKAFYLITGNWTVNTAVLCLIVNSYTKKLSYVIALFTFLSLVGTVLRPLYIRSNKLKERTIHRQCIEQLTLQFVGERLEMICH